MLAVWWAAVSTESSGYAEPTEQCSEGADGGVGGGGGLLCNLHPAGELVGVNQVSVPRMGEEVGTGNFKDMARKRVGRFLLLTGLASLARIHLQPRGFRVRW